jgi:nucleoside-diphosphate-sugar epimerase
MNILITGANGFIGQAITATLLSDSSISNLILTDIVEPDVPSPELNFTSKIRSIKADLTDQATCDKLFTSDLTHVYLLHGIMSGAAEANLDLGLHVNVDSTRMILDTLRKVKPGIRVIYSSACAVFGPPRDGELVTESTLPVPGSSYGAQKLICEILLNDFSRRGLIDGRILRLPTIIVRPGKPSGAASSFFSGIIREPLKGDKSQLPVAKSTEVWVCSTRTAVKNLIFARDIPAEKFGSGSRIVNLPGITVTVEQMLCALKEVGGARAVSLVEEKKDPAVEKIVFSWPTRFDITKAKSLGFWEDGTLVNTIRDYVRDHGLFLQKLEAAGL